jgi:hypothetical protein
MPHHLGPPLGESMPFERTLIATQRVLASHSSSTVMLAFMQRRQRATLDNLGTTVIDLACSAARGYEHKMSAIVLLTVGADLGPVQLVPTDPVTSNQ